MQLNEQQQKAVMSTEGYIRVIAGAGSGKTRALTERFRYIVEELGVSPDHVLSITFTNKAADEMKRRIRKALGDQDSGFITTFHGLCNRILSEEIHHLSWPKSYIIMDDEDKYKVLENIYEELSLVLKDESYNNILDKISKEKNKDFSYILRMTNENSLDMIDDKSNLDKDFLAVYQKYLKYQRKSYMLDFDDLINYTIYLFTINPEVIERWSNRFEYIQVDEFQDVSKKEYLIVQFLSRKHQNLFVVGDPDQTIYTWRGADIDIILNFDKDYPECQTIYLYKNYRSTPEILASSNSLIKHNTKRLDNPLESQQETFLKPMFFHAKSRKDECLMIANEIDKLHAEGKEYRDIAILYRSGFLSREMEEALMKSNIPYVIYNGVEFYSRKEIKDCLCYLRMVLYNDDISFERTINTPSRAFGKAKMGYLKSLARENNLYETLKLSMDEDIFDKKAIKDYISLIEEFKNKYESMSVLDTLDEMLKKSKYEDMLMKSGDLDRLDNIAELKNSIREYEQSYGEKLSLEEFLRKIALVTQEANPEEKDKVKLMTIHTSKGLEFDTVFVQGLNEGTFPSRKIRGAFELEEERRICYVALTRAKTRLYFSDAEGFDYKKNFMYPSRFIFNIDEATYTMRGHMSEDYKKRAMEALSENNYSLDVKNTFIVGEIVIHPVFGEGTIISIDSNGYTVSFNGKERVISKTFKNLKKKD